MQGRDIKFRAWDKGLKVMIGPHTLWEIHEDGQDFDHESTSAFINREYELIEKSDITWLQYTGLKDKDGQDIYEGDVVETEFSGRQVVRWDRDGWDPFRGSVYEGDCAENPAQCEVIGNAFENPQPVDKSID